MKIDIHSHTYPIGYINEVERLSGNEAEKVLEIIEEGQREGIIRKDVDIYIIRQLLLGILEHVVTRWLLKGQKHDLMDDCSDVSRVVIDGMGRSTESRKSR